LVECLLNPIPHEKGDCCEGKAGRAGSGRNAASCDDSFRQHLEAEPQSVKEQYETPDQGELRASNEELRAINKELRSAEKELETGKEELQWANEDLVTVSRDLKSDVADLGRANSDLQNLMVATDIGTIFLDRQLSVKGFTPRVQDVFNLIPADIGRPLSDITHKLKYDELAEDAAKVLRNLGNIEHEVQNNAGAWFLARIGPYRTLEGKIDGVVMTFVDITRRKLSEEKLWWQAAMVASSHDAIISCSRLWKVVSWNDAAERLFGYKEAEVISRDIKFLSPPNNEAELNEIRSAIARGEGKTLETVRVKKNGEPVNVSITFSLVKDGTGKAIGATEVLRDISSRKKAQEALRASDERFRLLMEGAKDYAMFLIEPNNVISYWSEGAQRVFGWSAEEAIGKRGELIFTPEDRAAGRVQKEMAIALQKGSASDCRWHLRKDGSRIWVDGVMRRLDGEGRQKVRGFAKIARDATEQRIAEEELKNAHAELEHRVMERTAELLATNTELHNEMKRRQTLEREILEVTERERSRVSQDLHDGLCQELTATAFFLKSKSKAIARKTPDCARVLLEAAETVNENAGRARDLARGLNPFELGAGGLLVALRELATRANERTPCRCEFSRALTVRDESIAMNLYRVAQEAVNNALKYARASEIIIGLRKEDHDVVLTIRDDGTGIRSLRKKKTMGIHMMKYRADVCGGKLEIESRRGHGTTVTCRVPLGS
jgi:two-component system CheB/CheR fusion protein